jgi:hypothetical protein
MMIIPLGGLCGGVRPWGFTAGAGMMVSDLDRDPRVGPMLAVLQNAGVHVA